MKQLRYLILLFSFTIAFIACKKELSDENGNPLPQTAQWEFSETKVFSGSVDTAHLVNTGAVSTLTFEGASTDGTGKIFMQVFGSAITAATFRNPNVLFEYSENGSAIYYNVPSNTDAFSVVINTIDSASVTGTFSGEVSNATGEIRTIANGKFTLILSGATNIPPPTVGDNCIIERVGYFDLNSGLPYAAVNTTFNADNRATNVVFYDSANQTVFNTFALRYSTNRIDVDAEQYFETEADGRIRTFHGYVDANTDPTADKAIIYYTYDDEGHMIKAGYAHESEPTVIGQEIKYTWTNGNLVKMVIGMPDSQERVEIEYGFDLTKSPKSFLSFFPNYEIVLLQSAINIGKISTNLITTSKVTTFDASGAAGEPVDATYDSYVIDSNGYVQSFQISGYGSMLQGDTKYTLSYRCR